ncbi:chitin binding domain-containing protein [Pochonia chlamydosporia 170]|uniref:Chitin binding domain-containing protein n=1 Tax=Pochonia chlamydosporia 170 TaxID=1380566 RepID=A0A179EW92_METCM|nr:chitin binding domain-containing protein [Pochonia chlamydosporia 170]OAQ57454.1 chitin binding domain-containing protein [Pochonia chlamydosporia 170]
MHSFTLVFATLAAFPATGVSAHGFMSKPFCRGCEKANTKVDDLKSPNVRGQICRGEPAGKVTDVGRQVTLGLTITAPHVGPCEVYILKPDLSDANIAKPVASKRECAAPGKVGPMTVNIPGNISGRRVLRWKWQACQVTPCEQYENCADINVGG